MEQVAEEKEEGKKEEVGKEEVREEEETPSLVYFVEIEQLAAAISPLRLGPDDEVGHRVTTEHCRGGLLEQEVHEEGPVDEGSMEILC